MKLHINKHTHVCAFASFPASNIFLLSVAVEQCVQTCVFQFKHGFLTRPFFSLGGLGLCQKVCICMPNLVMLITHFGQKRKYWPSKCPSRPVQFIVESPEWAQADFSFSPAPTTQTLFLVVKSTLMISGKWLRQDQSDHYCAATLILKPSR